MASPIIEKRPWETNYRFMKDQNVQRLLEKTVVIMGDSVGVGLATAVLLAQQGAPVFLAAKNLTELKRALVAINQAGGEGDGMVADLSRADECLRFFILPEGWLGRIDAVVNTLSTGEQTGAQSSDIQPGDLKTANTKSLKNEMALASQNLCTREAIQRMQARGQGHVININLTGYPRSGNFPEQREAANLRRRASEHGIRVTVIESGGDGWRESGSTRFAASAGAAPVVLSAQDIARCVIDSLAQPFGVDMVVLPGKLAELPV
jgi:NADP-dependent 3-hydroxy acid dehydrogenase YdfG